MVVSMNILIYYLCDIHIVCSVVLSSVSLAICFIWEKVRNCTFFISHKLLVWITKLVFPEPWCSKCHHSHIVTNNFVLPLFYFYNACSSSLKWRDSVQFKLLILSIHVLLMCNTGNENLLSLRTSWLQNICNATVMSLGSLTGQRLTNSLLSPWFRHNTYHHQHYTLLLPFTIVISKTIWYTSSNL